MQMHMRVALLWHLVSVSGIRNLVCGYGFWDRTLLQTP
jgi:hypothetical protein